jgi:hypothetical protein
LNDHGMSDRPDQVEARDADSYKPTLGVKATPKVAAIMASDGPGPKGRRSRCSGVYSPMKPRGGTSILRLILSSMGAAPNPDLPGCGCHETWGVKNSSRSRFLTRPPAWGAPLGAFWNDVTP